MIVFAKKCLDSLDDPDSSTKLMKRIELKPIQTPDISYEPQPRKIA